MLVPGKPDSAGSQFFVCVTDQPALDGKYTIFGQVSDGIEVVQKISEAPADANGLPADRIEIRSVTIRDTPPPEPELFSTESVEELARYRAILETSAGEIVVVLFPDKAPRPRAAVPAARRRRRLRRHVVPPCRPGLRRADGLADIHVDRSRENSRRLVRPLQPEFNDTKHVKGILSMARGDDPASALTSFFIVTGDAPSLDGKYTVFGRVVNGMDVVEAIEQTPVNGEAPVNRIDLRAVKSRPGSRQVPCAMTPSTNL